MCQKLYKKKIDNLTRPVSIKDIELLINNLLKQKAPDPDGFTSKFHQTFNEEINTNSLSEDKSRGNSS